MVTESKVPASPSQRQTTTQGWRLYTTGMQVKFGKRLPFRCLVLLLVPASIHAQRVFEKGTGVVYEDAQKNRCWLRT